MHDTALLAWVKSEKVFLKIQPGTGDNLLREDIRAGYVDYYLWSTFRPQCIDIDGELDMDCLDSGMFLFTENPGAKAALQSCYKEAFSARNMTNPTPSPSWKNDPGGGRPLRPWENTAINIFFHEIWRI